MRLNDIPLEQHGNTKVQDASPIASMNHAKDITNLRFGKLIAIAEIYSETGHGKKGSQWLFECDCGTRKILQRRNVTRTKKPTISCGCSRVKHGLSTKKSKHHYLIDAWQVMKKRCLSPRHPSYQYYGGRKISLFAEWIDNCAKFAEWVLTNLGERPEHCSLDRIDRDGDYVPGNLRWYTKTEQLISRPCSNPNKKPIEIHQYALDGTYLKSFKSVNAAAKSLIADPLSGSRLAAIARSPNNQTKGYIWKIGNE